MPWAAATSSSDEMVQCQCCTPSASHILYPAPQGLTPCSETQNHVCPHVASPSVQSASQRSLAAQRVMILELNANLYFAALVHPIRPTFVFFMFRHANEWALATELQPKWVRLPRQRRLHKKELVSWSLTSLFSTNMAISETIHKEDSKGIITLLFSSLWRVVVLW